MGTKNYLDILEDTLSKEYSYPSGQKWIADIKITRDDPVILIEGPKKKLQIIIGMLFMSEGSIHNPDFTLDPFEIAIDFEHQYISFFLKPECHA